MTDENNGKTINEVIEKIHSQACSNQKDSYIDPATGYQVMTAYYLKNRGYCCESGCRHCPYGFKKNGKK